MPPVLWAFQDDRPVIQVELSLPGVGQTVMRCLLADTGAGNRQSLWQMMLDENDCLDHGGALMGQVQLRGADSGFFPLYMMNLRISPLNFAGPVPAVAVSPMPAGFDGIAGFKFLNRFHYGNFGDSASFGRQ